MSKTFFFKILLKSSLSNRKSRVIAIVISLVLGVSLASALLNITFDVRERLSGELRGYGANILLVPRDTTLQVGLGKLSFGSMSGEGFIREDDLTQIDNLRSAEHLVAYIPYLYTLVDFDTQNVVLSGTWFDSLLKVNPSWRLEGKFPNRDSMDSAVIGVGIAEKAGLNVGDSLEIRYGWRIYNLSVVGILSSGSSEDNQVLVSLSLAQDMTRRYGSVHTVQLRYSVVREELEIVAEELAKVVPGVEAKVITQVAEAEEVFLSKIQIVTTVLTISVLAASAFAIMCTMSVTLLERQKEIGLMLTLGANPRKIAQLFLTEALVLGFVGGLVGYFLGVGMATAVWLRIFDTVIFPRLVTFPAVVAVAMGVTLTAFLLPIRQAVRLNPAVTLRGE